MKKSVFISHSTQDKTVAGMVCQALEQERISCWIAPRDVPYGENAFEAIPQGVAEASVLVLILSSNANSSKYVQRELQLALDYKKLIVPFRIEDIRPEGAVNFMLTGVQWLDAFVPPVERHIAALVERIAAIVEIERTQPAVDAGHAPRAALKPQRKRTVGAVWIAAAAVALAAAAGIGWKALHPRMDDAVIQQEVAQALRAGLQGQGVSVDCLGCVPPQAFANVSVSEGAVTVVGSGTVAASDAVHSVPISGLPGVRSVTYAFAVGAAWPAPGGGNWNIPHAAGKPAVQTPPADKATPNTAITAPSAASADTPEQLRAKSYVMQGQQLLKEQNYESAANHFEQALNLDPNNAAAKSGLRTAKKALGEPE